VATAPRVGRCESDESAAEDDVAESVDIVRLRSIGVRGCTGSVAAECADDVDGRRKIELENCLPGDADCIGVLIVRMLGGDVDTERPGGGEEESCACAASDETLSGARWP
jgi:hypothetical protein